MMPVKKTICPLDCPDSCGMLAVVENGRVTALKGDPDHPYTNGFICRKMRQYPKRMYSEGRLLYPQVRTGGKGEGRFARISWTEAWDILATRLGGVIRDHGGEAVLPFCYAGNMGVINRFAGFPLFHRMGATRIEQTICSAAAAGGWKMVCGKAGGSPPERAAEAELIIAWGINIRTTNVHFWQYVSQARKNGAMFLVVDPYRNDTARRADIHIRVKPGGDSALALGILKLLAERGWLDHEFIANETVGFERLAAYLERTPYECFETDSGIDRKDMEQIASLLRRYRKTFIRLGVGMTRNSRGGMAVRAVTSLAAACGLFDGKTGRGVLLFSGAFGGDSEKLTFPELDRQGARTINMIHLGKALTVLDPPIKALVVYNSNPLSVAPDGTAVRRGLSREDLFTVVHEQVMTPTARYADLLLPATTFLENRDLYKSYGHFYLGVADPVVEPVGESLSNFDFFQTLAGKLGYTDPPFHQTLDDRLSSYLKSVEELPGDFSISAYQAGNYVESIHGRAAGSLMQRGFSRFRFVDGDNPSLPMHASLIKSFEFDNEDLQSRYPYRMITPPNDKLLNSTFGERYEGEPGTVLIHPEDAQREEIEDGELVVIRNFRGWVPRRAAVTDDTQKGLVVAEGIYWPVRDTEEESGVNDLVSQCCSDIGGGALFHETRVRIERF